MGRIRKVAVTKSGKPIGRTREIDAAACLSLVLYWYGTSGSVARATAMAFGLTSTPMHTWIKVSSCILLCVFQSHHLARVHTPTHDGIVMNSYLDAIGAKCPILCTEKVWAGVDGLEIPLQSQQSGQFKIDITVDGKAPLVRIAFLFWPWMEESGLL